MTTAATAPKLHRARAQAARSTLCLPMLAMLATAGHAASFSAVAGGDYYDGADGQITRGLVAAMGADFSGAQASLAAVRYDDSGAGLGTSLTAGLGVPLGVATMLRAQGTSFIGDETYRAWRAKIGPRFGLPGGRTVTMWYSHYQDNQETTSDGAVIESEIPLIEKLTARANGSYASVSQGTHSWQGAIGLGWKLVPQVELSGEVGLAQNGGAAAATPGPSRRLQLPLIGGGGGGPGTSGSETESGFSPTALVGFRISLP